MCVISRVLWYGRHSEFNLHKSDDNCPEEHSIKYGIIRYVPPCVTYMRD